MVLLALLMYGEHNFLFNYLIFDVVFYRYEIKCVFRPLVLSYKKKKKKETVKLGGISSIF